MSLTESLRKGMVLRHDGQLYNVLDFHAAHSGKQRPTVHVKLRHLKNGHIVDRTLDQLGRVEEVPTEFRSMQYLYHRGDRHIFMDDTTFEETPIEKDAIGTVAEWLVESETYRVFMVEGQASSVEVPPVVAIEVTETAPVEHGGGQGSVYKDARLACGLRVSVPLFIKTGDKIRVNRENREYVGKVH